MKYLSWHWTLKESVPNTCLAVTFKKNLKYLICWTLNTAFDKKLWLRSTTKNSMHGKNLNVVNDIQGNIKFQNYNELFENSLQAIHNLQ